MPPTSWMMARVSPVRRPVRLADIVHDLPRRAAFQRHARQGPFEQPVVPGVAGVIQDQQFAARGNREQVHVLAARSVAVPGYSGRMTYRCVRLPSSAALNTIVFPSGMKRAAKMVCVRKVSALVLERPPSPRRATLSAVRRRTPASAHRNDGERGQRRAACGRHRAGTPEARLGCAALPLSACIQRSCSFDVVRGLHAIVGILGEARAGSGDPAPAATSAGRRRSACGSCSRMAAISDAWLLPSNARLPVAIS